MKLIQKLRTYELVEALKKVRSNEEVHHKFKVRLVLLREMARAGLLDCQGYHDQYCRSLIAYAEKV